MSQNNHHHIYVDFHVTSNKDYLIVSDLSNWLHIDEKPSVIDIYIPGATKPVTKYFQKYKVNKFNSFDLDLNCTENCLEVSPTTLPDGIYKIVVKGSPESFNKESYYLKDDESIHELDQLYLNNIDTEHEAHFLVAFNNLESLLRGVVANLRLDRIDVAKSLFSKFNDYLQDLSKCPHCYVFL